MCTLVCLFGLCNYMLDICFDEQATCRRQKPNHRQKAIHVLTSGNSLFTLIFCNNYNADKDGIYSKDMFELTTKTFL